MDSGGEAKKILSKGLTGNYELPVWVAVFILVAGLVALGGYYGFKQYKSYEVRQANKERATEETLLTQQQELTKAKEEIDALKNGRSGGKKAEDVLVSQLEGRLAAVVKEWRPRTASVRCRWNGLLGEEISNGSGLWMSPNNTVITSDHVVKTEGVFIGPPAVADSCSVKLPGGEEMLVNKEDISGWQGVAEVAVLKIKNPSSAMRQTVSTLNSVCRVRAASGDRVVVLGYPAIGAKNDVTVTEGIISGYEENFYITSAKIERGDSGGVTVLIDKDCYLGIPTFVRFGGVESLGRILDSRLLVK